MHKKSNQSKKKGRKSTAVAGGCAVPNRLRRKKSPKPKSIATHKTTTKIRKSEKSWNIPLQSKSALEINSK
jgi:hypothetical protein